MRQVEVLKGYAVAIASIFAGSSVVHALFKPDLSLPIDAVRREREETTEKAGPPPEQPAGPTEKTA